MNLPLANEVEGTDSTDRPTQREMLETATILLVEDEPALRRLAARVLTGVGHTVLTAVDGTEALQLARDHKGAIELLLTDVVMPKMSGTSLAAELRTERPGIRVLFMSGYRAPDVSSSPLPSGAALLEKPFSATALKTCVGDVMSADA